MMQTAQEIYKRINLIKRSLSETDKVSEIIKDLEAQGVQVSESQVEKDIRAIYKN